MRGIDLHIHSSQSDGELAPAEAVRRAAALGLGAVSITDHDSTDGIEEAMEAGVLNGVEVVPGVELSTRHRGLDQVHLLGYYIDRRNQDLENNLIELRDSRIGRGKRLVQRINRRLAEEGKPAIDFAMVESLARKVVSRPHIAKIMTDLGLAESVPDAFRRYLVPLNIQKHKLGFAEAVSAVRGAGGIAVLAHPNLIAIDRRDEIPLLDEFVRMGLQGLEVYYNSMTAEETEHYRVLALERGLMLTGGSDFHGFDTAGEIGKVHGGRTVPAELLETLKETFLRSRTTLAVHVFRNLGGADSAVRSMAAMSGAEIVDVRDVAAGFPKFDSQSPQGMHIEIAMRRIIALEAELRLARRKSTAVVLGSLDRKGADDLAAMAERCGADAVFILGRDAAEQCSPPAPSIVYDPVSRKASMMDPRNQNNLSHLAYFTLRA